VILWGLSGGHYIMGGACEWLCNQHQREREKKRDLNRRKMIEKEAIYWC
jgi:hypothetical protein